MSSIGDGNNDREGVSNGGNVGNVKLFDRVRKLLGAGASASLSWEEFVSDFLARDRVERLVVGHDGWARVHLKGASTSRVDATHGISRGNSGPPRHGEGAMASWLGWTGFRLPSLLSWEFDDVASEVSSTSLGSDSTDSSEGLLDGDDGRRGEGGAGGKDLTAVAVEGKEDEEEASSSSRLYLQIGRPSYLERNLKLAYLRLDIPPHR